MGRKAKISSEIKIKFVEEYLNGSISQSSIAILLEDVVTFVEKQIYYILFYYYFY